MTSSHFIAIANVLAGLKPDRGNKHDPASVRTKGAAAFEQWKATVREFDRLNVRSYEGGYGYNSAKFLAACGFEE